MDSNDLAPSDVTKLVNFSDMSVINNVRKCYALCNQAAPIIMQMMIDNFLEKPNAPVMNPANWGPVKEILDRGIGAIKHRLAVDQAKSPALIDTPESKRLFMDAKAEELLRMWHKDGRLKEYVERFEQEDTNKIVPIKTIEDKN